MSRILIVDDLVSGREAMAKLLQREGFEVAGARNGAEALARLKEGGVDLILLDHMMPKVSGDAFVRKLRRTGAQMPVIVISGLAEAQEEYEGLDVRFLNKPCPPEELIASVRAALGRKE